MLYASRVLDLNADTCEFCPIAGNEQYLAVGTYQLCEASQTRQGKLYSYCVDETKGAKDVTLVDKSVTDVPGIFDMRWFPKEGLEGKARLGLALADGSLNIFELDEGQFSELCSSTDITETGMLVSLDWCRSPQSDPHIIAVSSSSGEIGIAQLNDGGLQPLMKWQAHDLEAWAVGQDCWKVGVVYSGADDCKFKGWDINSGSECPIFINSKEHSAGVCCITSSHHQEHLVGTGSYDEHVRIWDMRNTTRPLLQHKVSCGGGVWRLKFHPHDPKLILAACMHNGFAVLKLNGMSDHGLECVEEYKGQDSLAYGADWSWRPNAKIDGRNLIATCSFYDKLLHLWEPVTTCDVGN